MYIITSKTRSKIQRNDRGKLREELRHRHWEMGLQGMEPLKGQNEIQQLKDIENNKNKIVEQMGQQKEQSAKERSLKRRDELSNKKMNESKIHEFFTKKKSKQ